MNEYILTADDWDDVGLEFESKNQLTAIEKAKDHIDELREWGTVWKLHMIERKADPERHDAIDAKGSHHQLLAHTFTFADDGTILLQ